MDDENFFCKHANKKINQRVHFFSTTFFSAAPHDFHSSFSRAIHSHDTQVDGEYTPIINYRLHMQLIQREAMLDEKKSCVGRKLSRIRFETPPCGAVSSVTTNSWRVQ